MKKKCTACERKLILNKFTKDLSKEDGLSSRCKNCKADADKEIRERNEVFILEYLLSHPCVDCGEENLIVLDFDHTEDDKRASVSELAKKGYSIDVINKEILKCDVRCSNCHRIVTSKRGNHFRYRYSEMIVGEKYYSGWTYSGVYR